MWFFSLFFRGRRLMHMLYAGISLKVLQSLMGHKSISSTEVYTKVFALDVAARHRVQFKNDGHYFCGAGGNRLDGSDEVLT
nr:tyrosine-type recombinase/integrase [Escherichia coli]